MYATDQTLLLSSFLEVITTHFRPSLFVVSTIKEEEEEVVIMIATGRRSRGLCPLAGSKEQRLLWRSLYMSLSLARLLDVDVPSFDSSWFGLG
ncbi:hypothetical protein L6452_14167 [Arctium lappa]|uniref:Uncharacterized protein n=1 Tax=Arctium lappa TaxID=4217 RepID=A0ACB9CK72_ARCLA|nr:hypothetical protein L6452_14167 [Arctium lappa]